MRFSIGKYVVLGMASAVLLFGVCAEAQATIFAWDFEGATVNGPAANIGDGGTQDITYSNGATTTSSTAAFGNDSFSLASSGLTRGLIDPFFDSAFTQMSISVWVKADNAPNNGGIVDRTSDSMPTHDSQFRMTFFASDEFRPQMFFRNGGSLSQNLSNIGGTAGQWNHYVASYDGTQALNSNRLRLWVNNVEATVSFNGAEIPTSIIAPLATEGDWRVGIRQDGSNPILDGFFDDLLITNQTLSTADVNTLFTQGVRAFLIPEPTSIVLLSLGLATVLLRRQSV